MNEKQTGNSRSCGAAPCSAASKRRVICRFSCGAASAVATKIALAKYPHAEIYYCDTGSEHEDNARFMADCGRWFGRKINVLRSNKFSSVESVLEKERFLVSHRGAPCTSELKRGPGDAILTGGEIEIYGYTAEEEHRAKRIREVNFDRNIECPLIEKNLTKSDCLGWLERAGIELPAMYRLGFRNNNCIGCVKARDNLDYWKRVRKYFPTQFAHRAGMERQLGVTINRVTRNGVRSEIYLDEIEDGDPKGADNDFSCGLFCMAEMDSVNAANLELTSERSELGQAPGSACLYCEDGYISATDSCGSKIVVECNMCKGTGESK